MSKKDIIQDNFTKLKFEKYHTLCYLCKFSLVFFTSKYSIDYFAHKHKYIKDIRICDFCWRSLSQKN